MTNTSKAPSTMREAFQRHDAIIEALRIHTELTRDLEVAINDARSLYLDVKAGEYAMARYASKAKAQAQALCVALDQHTQRLDELAVGVDGDHWHRYRVAALHM